jgi:hypothetical protein
VKDTYNLTLAQNLMCYDNLIMLYTCCVFPCIIVHSYCTKFTMSTFLYIYIYMFMFCEQNAGHNHSMKIASIIIIIIIYLLFQRSTRVDIYI